MIRHSLFKAAHRLVLQPWHRQTRGMTLGTRTVVIDAQSNVLLVRHSYAPGWMLPGGGVERGETIAAAARRELHEETGVVAEEEPRLHGLFLNDESFPGDHIAVLVLRRFRQEAFKPGLEIAEARFFAGTELPDTTSPGTRRRIEEVRLGKAAQGHW